MIRVVSLFAGIGGFDLGLERAGFEIVAHVEKDKNCRKLLAAKFPNALAQDDVCAIGARDLPPYDALAAGFPCQGLSVAGLRAGLADPRSNLFYQFARITHETQPSFVIWENVPGLRSSDNGRDMCRILMAFQRLGYNGCWRSFDAQHFGLAQRRARIFGVFARGDIGVERCAEVLSLQEGMRGHPSPRRKAREEVAGTLGGSSQSGGFRTTDLDNSGAFVVGALDTNNRGATPEKASAGHYVVGSLCANGKASGSATRQDAELGMLVAHTLRCPSNGAVWRGDGCDNLIAHTLRGEGFDTSEDGTGRGTPLVVSAYRATGNDGCYETGDKVACLNTATDPNQNVLAFDLRERKGGAQAEGMHGTANIRASSGGSSRSYVAASAVRRLTPLECERLQGFPDNWTAGFADSVRYQMLGNAVAVPVAEWIARRLKIVMNSLSNH